MDVEEFLKHAEGDVMMLAINVKESAKSFKYIINEGYVQYDDERQVSVMEAIETFKKEHQHYTYVCADTMWRETGDFNGKSFKWHYDMRFN